MLIGMLILWIFITNLIDVHYFFSVNFHKYNDAGDIVDDGVVFFPFLGGSSDQSIASCLGRMFHKERPNNLGYLLVL